MHRRTCPIAVFGKSFQDLIWRDNLQPVTRVQQYDDTSCSLGAESLHTVSTIIALPDLPVGRVQGKLKRT